MASTDAVIYMLRKSCMKANYDEALELDNYKH